MNAMQVKVLNWLKKQDYFWKLPEIARGVGYGVDKPFAEYQQEVLEALTALENGGAVVCRRNDNDRKIWCAV